MNSLSWMIYATQICDAFRTLLAFGLGGCFLYVIVGLMVVCTESDSYKEVKDNITRLQRELDWFEHKDPEEDPPVRKQEHIKADLAEYKKRKTKTDDQVERRIRNVLLYPACIALVFILGLVFVPTERTMLLITASQTADTVVRSPEAQSLFKALEQSLQKLSR